jgi:hypothetical protein
MTAAKIFPKPFIILISPTPSVKSLLGRIVGRVVLGKKRQEKLSSELAYAKFHSLGERARRDVARHRSCKGANLAPLIRDGGQKAQREKARVRPPCR